MLWIIAAVIAIALLAGLAALSPRRPAVRPRGAERRRTGPGRSGPDAARRTGRPATRRAGRGRTGGGHARTRAGGRGAARPRPGEIWWADVPYEDGPGSKVRPCVVLHAHRDGAEVLKITSQDQSHRSDHVEIPTRDWDPSADHNSFLDLSGPVHVPAASFDNRAGVLDARIWARVRELYRIG